MKLKHMLAAIAVGSMSVTPVLAQSSIDRSSAPVAEDSEEAFGSGRFLNALIIAAIAAIGMVVLVVSDDDDEPVSP